MSTLDSPHLFRLRARGVLNQHIQDKLAKGEIERVPGGSGYRVTPKFQKVNVEALKAKIVSP